MWGSRKRGVTLVELMVSMGIFSLILTAVLSFYIESAAVRAKRDQQSERLRRFHLGLDKMEQLLREGRILDLSFRRLTFLRLTDLAEKDGFPDYHPAPAQLVSSDKGVYLLNGQEKTMLLPTKEGEHVIFQWFQEAPPAKRELMVLNISLYHSGSFEGRSDLFFHRTINSQRY